MDNMKSDSVVETDLAVTIRKNALGSEVEGTPSVREPSVLDAVSKPLHKNMGKPEASAGAP